MRHRQLQEILTVCPCCKAENVQAHYRFSDRCVDCGNRYAKYTVYRTQQKHNYSASRQKLIEAIENDYKILASMGCKVPHAFEHYKMRQPT